MDVNVTVRDKALELVDDVEFVCYNDDYVLVFDFDEEWNDHNVKTARFIYSKGGRSVLEEVVFSGNECPMPAFEGVTSVYVGVYAGDIDSTSPLRLKYKKSILDNGGLAHEDPPDDVYTQLLEAVDSVLVTEEARQIKEDVLNAQEAAEAAAAEAQEAFPVKTADIANKAVTEEKISDEFANKVNDNVTNVTGLSQKMDMISPQTIYSDITSQGSLNASSTSSASLPVWENFPYLLYENGPSVDNPTVTIVDSGMNILDHKSLSAYPFVQTGDSTYPSGYYIVTPDGASQIVINASADVDLELCAMNVYIKTDINVDSDNILYNSIKGDRLADGAVTVDKLETGLRSAISGAVRRSIVEVLPEIASANTNTIYMVPATETAENNVYNEFMAVNGAWEQIGSTAVDLSDYAKKSDVEYLESVLEDGTNYFYVEHAYSDSLGNKIHTTYATKEELRDAMYTVVDATGNGPDYYANGICFRVEDGEAVVGSTSGGTASAGWSSDALIIPAFIKIPTGETYKVTKIDNWALTNNFFAFATKYEEAKVYIPNTVTTFGSQCFDQNYLEYGGHLYIVADRPVPSSVYDAATTTVVRMDDPFRVVDDIKKPVGVLPITEGVFDSCSVYIVANKMSRVDLADIGVSASIYIRPGEEGWDNEWGLTVVQGETAQEVAWGISPHWGLGIAPTFAANTTTVCRLYYVGDTLCGEWVSV